TAPTCGMSRMRPSDSRVLSAWRSGVRDTPNSLQSWGSERRSADFHRFSTMSLRRCGRIWSCIGAYRTTAPARDRAAPVSSSFVTSWSAPIVDLRKRAIDSFQVGGSYTKYEITILQKSGSASWVLNYRVTPKAKALAHRSDAKKIVVTSTA